ncbi:hypothetical protein JRQ81_004382 [Phrynocephalus forsythii]|uniref:Ig-like domain-containing protein n=1 Tax=Phrynocephalus forsythii TaxID=171643 RepID=A0A9Q0XF20_9SAUR|nr:hypothetical protein JRQ81_004382 [Phrynocephalus forsythii]
MEEKEKCKIKNNIKDKPDACSTLQLTQSSLGVVMPGGSLKLTCAVTGVQVSDYCWHWIQQFPGKPGWVFARGSITVQYWGSLTVSDAHTKSSMLRKDGHHKHNEHAALSCSWIHPSFVNRRRKTIIYRKQMFPKQMKGLRQCDYFDYWGPGTLVTVSSASPSAPSLFPLLSYGSSSDNGAMTVGCLAKDFLPDSVTFFWDDKNNNSLADGTFKRFPSVFTGGTYTATSQASISETDWENKSPLFCRAKHLEVNKVVRVDRDTHCPVCPAPEMHIRAPPPKAFQTPYLNSTITCTATNLCMEKATIQWFKEGQLLDSGFTTNKLPLDNGKGYGIRSELVVTLREWNACKQYSCKVESGKYNNTLQISKCSFCPADAYVLSKVYLDEIMETTEDEELQSIMSILSTFIILFLMSLFYSATVTVIKTRGPTDPVAIVKYEACNWTDPEPIQGRILPPNCDEHTTETSLELVCLLQSLGPGKATVQWLKNGEMEQEPVEVKLAEKGDKNKGYIGFVRREISKKSWDEGHQHSCKVTPMQGSKNITIYTTSKCKACYGLRQPPTVSITKPSYRELLEKTGKVTCTATGLDLSNTKITWQVDGKPSSEVQDNMAKANASGCSKVTGSHTVSLEQWRKGTMFTCKAAGGCYEDVIQEEEIRNETGAFGDPNSCLLQCPLENSTALILICDVAGFYPREISISWRKDDVPLNESLYKNGIVTAAAGNISNTYSILKVGIEGAGGEGGRYTCVVHHSSSETEIIANENVPVGSCDCTFMGVASGELHNENQDEGAELDETNTVWNKVSTFIFLFVAALLYAGLVTFIKRLDVEKSRLISGATPTAPAMFPLSPCCQDQSEDQTTLGCMITGYFPEPVNVQWNSGAITTGIRTYPSIMHQSTGLYTLSSQLTIPTTTWNSGTFQCHVTHAASSSSINKEIEHCAAEESVAPTVQLFHSSCDFHSPDAIIELVCDISGFYPQEVKVNWLEGTQSKTSYSVTEPPRRDANSHTFSTTSRLNVSQAEWLQGTIYTCKVNHEGSQTQLERRAKKCEDDGHCPSGNIQIYLQHPTPEDLYINRDAKISCVVSNLESEEGLKLMWAREKPGSLKPDPLVVSLQPNGTYTAVGHLPITVQDWTEGEVFTCTVLHPNFTGPVTRKVAKSSGKRAPPRVYVFPPHRNEFNSPNQHVTLTCLAASFNPEDISVQWLKDNNAVMEDEYVNTPVLKDNREDAYFLYSKMTIPRSEWSNGSAFTCMVVHEALTMKFIQRTVERSQGNK